MLLRREVSSWDFEPLLAAPAGTVPLALQVITWRRRPERGLLLDMSSDYQRSRRGEDFIVRIAAALIVGHKRMRHHLSQQDARARAEQIADQLPGLFEDRVIELANA